MTHISEACRDKAALTPKSSAQLRCRSVHWVLQGKSCLPIWHKQARLLHEMLQYNFMPGSCLAHPQQLSNSCTNSIDKDSRCSGCKVQRWKSKFLRIGSVLGGNRLD